MLRGMIKTSVSFRYIFIVIAGIIILLGVFQVHQMPVDILPEFSPPYVEIQTEALGLSAKEVEQMITVPMEQDLLAGVAWLDIIRSESVPGLSSILVYFEPGTDLYRARQMVAERLAQSAVGLPHVSKPPTMIQPLSSTSRFMIVGLSSNELTLIEMSVLARWTIAPRLMGVPGVANVAIWGQRDRQLQVLVDPELLMAHDVSLEQVVETTGNALWVSSLSFLEASSPGTGGFIDTPNQRLNVWHTLPISSPEDLAEVPLEGEDSLLISDVAEVVEDHQPLIGDAIVNNSPNLMLVIEKLPGTNTLEVTRGVEAALAALRPGFTSIDFDATLFRPASYIETAISNLSRTMIIAALLMVLAFGLFLYDWRSAFISFLAVLLSLLAAITVLYLRGETLNYMVLAGLVIALGVVIDEAVVEIEHLMRRIRQNRQEKQLEPVVSVLIASFIETRGPITFGFLVTLLVILPIAFVTGATGAIFKPLAVSYTLAVAAAFVVALTVTPAVTVMLLSNTHVREQDAPFARFLKRSCDRLLSSSMHRTALVYSLVAVLIVLALAAIPFIKVGRILPTFREPYIMIDLRAVPGTSRVEMDRIVAMMGKELRSIPGVQNTGAHLGRAVFGDQVVGVDSAQLWVNIQSQADYDAVVFAVGQTVDDYIGTFGRVSMYLEKMTNSTIAQPDNTVTVRVFGEDLDVLRQQAEMVRQNLAGIRGVKNAYVELPKEEPAVEIEVNLNAAQRYGLKPGDIRRVAAIMFSGLQVGSLFEEQKVFDVIVWGSPEIRENLTDVRDLPIGTPDGRYIRLGDVAGVRVTSAPTVIWREGVSPYLDVHLSVQRRDIPAVLRTAKAALPVLTFPLEYHAEVLSDYADQQADGQRILITIVVVLTGILLLLQASSRNWRLAIAIFLTLPFALSGGVLAAFITRETLSVVSLLGLLGVLGLSVRSALMLVAEYQRRELHEGERFSAELIQQATRERVTPTLLSLTATGLALIAFVFPGNIPGYEIVHPMGFIMLGSLVTSTAFSLLVVPALYLKFGAHRETDLGFQAIGEGTAPEPASD